jgi:DNA-binding SARP family transcriptional activator
LYVLRVRVLGPLEVELDGAIVPSPSSQRPWRVFAYVALAPRPVARAELANAFWPDVLDASARASLRSALWALRKSVGDRLVVDGERVGLREDDGELWVDARDFEQLAVATPERALALCRGELLEGFEDEWALQARDRHRERAIELLERLAAEAERGGDHAQAVELSRRQSERDPFDEEVHRRLMTRQADAGDRAGALLTFRSLSDRLRRELGVAPSQRTRELAEQLRAEPSQPTVPADVAAPSRPTGLLALVGRDAELAELERVWRGVRGARGAVAVIRGEAGIGKTRLATELLLAARESGGRAAACAALDLGGAAPLSLWAELLRALLPSLPAPPGDACWPEDLAALVSELPLHFARGQEPRAAVAPDLARTRLFEAVVSLLEWAARDGPLLLVLEDAHAADAPSLELAAYAARRVAELPLMMLITRRALPHSAEADLLEHALRSRGLLA